MSKILYIKASPMGELSFSTVVADAFVEAYRQANPKDEIKTLDLFKEPLPDFNLAAASAKYKIMHGKEHSQQDRQIWNRIVSVIEEFKSADKYVLAVPMWNFSIPYRLKQYIDIIVQPGYTFGVTEDANYEGLVRAKRVFIAYARGGQYPQGTEKEAFDLQKKYLELILTFIGLSDVRSVVVEPALEQGPDTAERKRDEAMKKAKQMAKDF
jgi:FMN-dependent NADH-azoreductase